MSGIRNVTVVGAGTMGRGIAQVSAVAGFRVALFDAVPGALDAGITAIRNGLARAASKGKIEADRQEEILGRIRIETDLGGACRESDLVIEAVPESLDLKRSIFGEIERASPAGAILATNTSSLPVGKIAGATRSPARVVGMHFFNPVPAMPLLEVVRGRDTSAATVEAAVDAGRRMGKDPIVVQDSPGFATSRLGVLLGLEAIRMVEAGVASPEDIDKAMTLGYRHPMGPLTLTDLVGLDVRLAIAEHLHRELESDAFRPPDLMRSMVSEGKLGKKTGQGFYRWDAE